MYYICKKSLFMNNSKTMAFKKGHAYLCVEKMSANGGVFVSEISNRHLMDRDSIDEHFTEIKDEKLLDILEGCD